MQYCNINNRIHVTVKLNHGLLISGPVFFRAFHRSSTAVSSIQAVATYTVDLYRSGMSRPIQGNRVHGYIDPWWEFDNRCRRVIENVYNVDIAANKGHMRSPSTLRPTDNNTWATLIQARLNVNRLFILFCDAVCTGIVSLNSACIWTVFAGERRQGAGCRAECQKHILQSQSAELRVTGPD